MRYTSGLSMRYRYFLLFIVCLGLLAGCQDKILITYPILVKDKAITVEVAATEEARNKGLMERQGLSPDSGMLFVFREDQHLDFWMKNTLLPLAIAFIRSDGAISQIKPMQPLSEETVRSLEPVKYALEMNQGWFKRNNIKEGDRVFIPVEIKSIKAE